MRTQSRHVTLTVPNVVEKSSEDADDVVDIGTLISAHSHTSRTHTVETTTVRLSPIHTSNMSKAQQVEQFLPFMTTSRKKFDMFSFRQQVKRCCRSWMVAFNKLNVALTLLPFLATCGRNFFFLLDNVQFSVITLTTEQQVCCYKLSNAISQTQEQHVACCFDMSLCFDLLFLTCCWCRWGFMETSSCNVSPSVLWHCWLGGRKGIRPVKTEWWDVGVVVWDEVQTCI